MQRRVEPAADGRIDRLVYELYGLSFGLYMLGTQKGRTDELLQKFVEQGKTKGRTL